jgi:hypothetical protein
MAAESHKLNVICFVLREITLVHNKTPSRRIGGVNGKFHEFLTKAVDGGSGRFTAAEATGHTFWRRSFGPKVNQNVVARSYFSLCFSKYSQF